MPPDIPLPPNIPLPHAGVIFKALFLQCHRSLNNVIHVLLDYEQSLFPLRDSRRL